MLTGDKGAVVGDRFDVPIHVGDQVDIIALGASTEINNAGREGTVIMVGRTEEERPEFEVDQCLVEFSSGARHLVPTWMLRSRRPPKWLTEMEDHHGNN